MRWIVDANNVVGSRPDGWWNDPPGAAARLVQHVAEWCRNSSALPGDQSPVDVVLVFDGRPDPTLVALAGGPLQVDFARRPGRDAADDRIVELAGASGDAEPLTVVTSDRGLIARLPPHVTVEGAGRFRDRIQGDRPGVRDRRPGDGPLGRGGSVQAQPPGADLP
jgi:hypothetical protein